MRIGLINIVFQKEIKDLFRDKRTIIVGILFPILLFPAICFFVNFISYRNTVSIKENLKIALINSNNLLADTIKSHPNVTTAFSATPVEDVKKGKFYLAVYIPDDFDSLIKNGKTAQVRIVTDDTSNSSIIAFREINSIIDSFVKKTIKKRLKLKKISSTFLSPVSIKRDMILDPGKGAGQMILSLILPLLLVTYCVISPLAVAADLGAGEKERGTLEPLLCTQADRFDLLAGKFLAITVIGIIGVTAFMTGFFLSYVITPDFFSIKEISFVLKPLSLTLIVIFTLMLIMISSATQLAVSLWAKSSKEAHILSFPIVIISMAAGYGTYMIDIKNIKVWYLNFPVLNISIVIKELTLGVFNHSHIYLAFLWSCIYIFIAFRFSKKIFSKEEIIL